MPDQPNKARALFLAAIEGYQPEQWPAFLDEACAGDGSLRNQVERLLRARAQLGSFHEAPQPGLMATVDESPVTERPGTVIGPYKLLEQIGEGGFGVVFMAEQQAPVRRKVALKVLKPGMDTRQVVARFEAERQALAIMDHPHIAKVLDGGPTASGRPYFVMDLVKGLPITEYCDQAQLIPRERLELFIHLCQAVQHAHQKGVIHRDLKPSNVLVMVHDTTPVVKVIDFGVAKALGQELTDKTLFTGFAQMIGTPLYMSPEQAGQSGVDIDTRSDIYSLGVLLYELLTGTTPFDKERLKEVGYDELRRIIREEEPPRPSTRLSTLGKAATTVSTQRRSDPQRLSRLCRGELDWIVMKCLEKDRRRRYETAGALAADVERYLHDEPVLACPPRVGYRLRKFARRNRGRLVAAGVLGFAFLVAAGSLGWAAHDRAARRARVTYLFEQALDRAEWFQEQGKPGQAQAALDRAELLAGEAFPDPGLEERLATLKGRLAADRRDKEFIARFEDIRLRVQSRVNIQENQFTPEAAFPAIREALRRYGMDFGVLAPAHAAALIRGRPARIRRNLIAALDECLKWVSTKDVATRRWLLATLHASDNVAWRGRARKALVHNQRTQLERLVGEVDERKQPANFLILVATKLPAQGKPTLLELLRRIQRAYPADLWANHWLAAELAASGRPAEAIRYYTAALVLRPDNPGIYLNRGNALFEAGEVDAAIADARQCVALAPRYAVAHNNLGRALCAKGCLDEAIAECRQAIRLKKAYAEAYTNLGNALQGKRRRDEAIAVYRQALRIKKDLRQAHNGLGNALMASGLLDNAIAEYRAAIRSRNDYPLAHYNLGNALAARGRLDEAVAEYHQALGSKQPMRQVYLVHYYLGRALQRKADQGGAVAAYRQAIRIHKDFAIAHCYLGEALRDQGQFQLALEELRLGHRLLSRDPRWRFPSAAKVRKCERLVKLEERLPGYLEGKGTPASPAERAEMAELCCRKDLTCAAARFFAEAFATQPKLADALPHRYNAACAAAQAGCGKGKDADNLDAEERARLRAQALNWLRADLDVWSRTLDKGPDRSGVPLATRLHDWLTDAGFAGVRGRQGLAKLPDVERQAWHRLWAEVAALRERALRTMRPKEKPGAKATISRARN
jgi:serine/threonine protein kinase/tetratricopeptide (TPR) repeat protein